MSKVSFDGESKIISINLGVTEIDVEKDLYFPWKRWVLQGNSNWKQAFRRGGGDPITSTLLTPKYFFLMNNWRILVDNGERVDFRLNLYTDENTHSGNPIIVGDASAAFSALSDSPVVVTADMANISKAVRKEFAKRFDEEIEVDSIDHMIDRIDKAVQK